MTLLLEISPYKQASSSCMEASWLARRCNTSGTMDVNKYCSCMFADCTGGLQMLKTTHETRFKTNLSVQNIFFVKCRNKAIITLTSPADGAADSTIPEVGTKVFAVVGGRVAVFGMPGGGATPSWVRLSRTAPVGSSRISLDTTPVGWPIGGQVCNPGQKF